MQSRGTDPAVLSHSLPDRLVHRGLVHLLYYWRIRAVRAAGMTVPARATTRQPARQC